MEPGVKVKLKVDLTRYLDGLVAGSEGRTIGQYGMWSRNMDTFTGVDFPGIGKLDVALNSLEIIDKDYLKKMDDYKKKKFENYKSAKDIILTTGPMGGFRYLSFEYIDDGIPSHIGIGFKKEAEEIIEYFKKLKKHIDLRIEK